MAVRIRGCDIEQATLITVEAFFKAVTCHAVILGHRISELGDICENESCQILPKNLLFIP